MIKENNKIISLLLTFYNMNFTFFHDLNKGNLYLVFTNYQMFRF